LLGEFDKVIIIKDKTLVYFGPYSKEVICQEFPNFNEVNELKTSKKK
jgi:hypothetical protein